MRQGFVSEGEEAQLKEEKDKRGNDGVRERERGREKKQRREAAFTTHQEE